MLRIGCFILLWHFLVVPYNYLTLVLALFPFIDLVIKKMNNSNKKIILFKRMKTKIIYCGHSSGYPGSCVVLIRSKNMQK